MAATAVLELTDYAKLARDCSYCSSDRLGALIYAPS